MPSRSRSTRTSRGRSPSSPARSRSRIWTCRSATSDDFAPLGHPRESGGPENGYARGEAGDEAELDARFRGHDGQRAMTPSLETRDLTIRFGGHVAVDHVSCAFRPGELTAIVGPNGAGKTTYFNLMSGQLRASDGAVLIEGEDVTALSAPRRTRLGLGRAFQLTNLFPRLSVGENVRLAVQAHAGVHYDMRRPWQASVDL